MKATHSQSFGGVNVVPAPISWRKPCVTTECSLHQLSPYIGKLKSSIAGDLVERFTRQGDLVVDPFAGAGTIPLEASIRLRRVFAADISPYARILTRAKLSPPITVEGALASAQQALHEASQLPAPDLRTVTVWVRKFFHPQTLREIINFACVCRTSGNDFLMACLLGILHHQRPGFLSFPSSHLVPYLRNRKYPLDKFPEMYTYRDLASRLLAKIKRAYKRFDQPSSYSSADFEQCAVESLGIPDSFDAMITSPPYMNALDYGRDNRLRLWFVDNMAMDGVDNDVTKRHYAFVRAMRSLAAKVEHGLRPKGYCVFVVGEEVYRGVDTHPSETVFQIINEEAPSLRLKEVIADRIPDVRRTRRECRGVKTEHVLVFRRN